MIQNPELDAASRARAPRDPAPARPTRPPVDWSETPIPKMRAALVSVVAINVVFWGAIGWWLL